MVEQFKTLNNIFEKDMRHEEIDALKTRTISLEKWWRTLSQIELQGNPPERVKEHFDTAKNLFLYSYFAYDLCYPALLQLFMTVEFAFKEKYRLETGVRDEKKFRGLKQRAEYAVEEHWVSDDGLPEHIAQNPNWKDKESKLLAMIESLASFRNSLAHGSSFLNETPQLIVFLEGTAAIIDQIFHKK